MDAAICASGPGDDGRVNPDVSITPKPDEPGSSRRS